MTALTEISGDKHVVTRGGRGEVSRVMKAKFFAKIQQLSIPFFNTFDNILMMTDWLFNFSTFLFSIYGSQFSEFRFFGLSQK